MRAHRVAALAAASACLGAVAVPAQAKIAPVKRTSKGATQLARSIAAKPNQVNRAIWSSVPPRGVPGAVSTTKLTGFPRSGSSFGILSNGDARLASHKNTKSNTSTANLGPLIRGARDVAILRVYLKVPKGASCLSVRFRFLSEEFPEFVHDIYNDAFIAELDNSTWDASGSSDPTISSPDNFAQTADGHAIRVNSAGPTATFKSAAKGTTYDAATRLLRASIPVKPGGHSLYLSIFDQGDRQYDSSVFLDNLTLDKRTPCKSGAVYEGK
jgi:hypothetical protein